MAFKLTKSEARALTVVLLILVLALIGRLLF
jgi:hypothetical protein